ncbi:spermatogenesis-defective protein 39 homolog isoform X2 [Ruditapes philippinarum]|uniref:spermatogenesis-defective protein 39 homolog isoform X2 n=1 Tax=Ruditapes philippinarum TaxID=129788 RepID=UPI00295BEF14|nr:spermatogenesis-defective protein 39 homolog isoform X2 [Ruditapes philippinarum]
MSLDENEEDYWGSSKVKKKVNIFDDSVTVEAASDLAKFQKSLADDDDDDGIGFGDDPSSSIQSLSISQGQSLPSQTRTSRDTGFKTPSGPSQPRPRFEPQIAPPQRPLPSHMTHSRSRSDVMVSSMGKMSLAQSPSTPGYKMDSEPDLSTVLGSNEQRQTNRPALSRQEQEIEYLKQKLQQAENAIGTAKLKVEETIKRMIMGQPYALEQYKSKEEKLALLDKAIDTHDGNAIIASVVFMKRTLKDGIFNLELLRRPEAVDQYLAYLKAHYNLNEYSHMLEKAHAAGNNKNVHGMLNRAEELAMFKYKQAVTVDDPSAKIQRVKGCLQAHFETTPGLEHDCGLLQQQISLLQRQRPVDVGDEMMEKEGKHIVFNQMPRKASIINMPVITTLYYCCLYHYEDGENLLSSPAGIRKEHQLTEKQFIWTAIKARARLRKWTDIEDMCRTKGFFGTKMRCVIGFDKVAFILNNAGAPQKEVSKYLMLVDDVEKRLELAKKFSCHHAAIETYRAQRDKQGLQMFIQKLKPNSEEWFIANGALQDKTVKWKT